MATLIPRHVKDALGTAVKALEAVESDRAAGRGDVIVARLDGRAFHTFVHVAHCAKPFDDALTAAMIETARQLVEEQGARVAYVQSDEISLLFPPPAGERGEHPFGGRYQKLASTLASAATAYLSLACRVCGVPVPSHVVATFDCRVFATDRAGATAAFAWRELDCVTNAVSSVARHVLGHAAMHKKGTAALLAAVAAADVDFSAYPAANRSGTYVRRCATLCALDDETVADIPVAHRPTEPFMRNLVVTRAGEGAARGLLHRAANAEAVLFDGAAPGEGSPPCLAAAEGAAAADI